MSQVQQGKRRIQGLNLAGRDFSWIWIPVLFFSLSTLLCAEEFHTKAQLISDHSAVKPGETFDVGIHLIMDEHWHTYWKDPGDSGLATSVKWKLPSGVEAGPIRWPQPKLIETSGLKSNGYEKETVLFVSMKVAENFKMGTLLDIQGTVDWLECKDICVPGTAEVKITLPIESQSRPADPNTLALMEVYRKQIPIEPEVTKAPGSGIQSMAVDPSTSPTLSLWQALIGAFLGGIILNLMPCVLPVIAIKILGFVKQSGENPAQTRRLGWIFASGVIVSFLGLAGLTIGLREFGHQVGWGIQFQQPGFLAIMAWVVVLIALNFFGVFEIELASSATNKTSSLISSQGGAGAFWNGVLATTLATPCTAPFLAPAVGFALSQPATSILSIFLAVGAGLSLPYVLLSSNPGLLKWLPKPGIWMLRFKQAMGFPMIATALWLVWTLGTGYGLNAVGIVLIWLLIGAFAVWLVAVMSGGRGQYILGVIILVLMVGHFKVLPVILSSVPESGIASHSLIPWKPYSKQSLDEALRSNQPVFVDFTASWCLTCQVNKKTSLEIPEIAEVFKKNKVIPLLADWTRMNADISEALTSFGRAGVPLYVYYPADRTRGPVLLPEILTPSIVRDAIEKQGGSSASP